MQTPDITTAQIVALISAIAGLLAAFGLNLTAAQQHDIIQVVLVGPSVLFAADAWIRSHRAGVAKAQLELEAAAHRNAAARADGQA